jgi:3D (Asp-Asp-Asp) domain-containing protein
MLLLPGKATSKTEADQIQLSEPTQVFANVEKEVVIGNVTMYSSEVSQTDDTPFITANGDTVGEGTIACPSRLKFGTQVQINGKVYRCNDRMHQRYRDGNYFDIWTPETAEAREWGRRNVEVTIYQEATTG